jgi:hypothetical protein
MTCSSIANLQQGQAGHTKDVRKSRISFTREPVNRLVPFWILSVVLLLQRYPSQYVETSSGCDGVTLLGKFKMDQKGYGLGMKSCPVG